MLNYILILIETSLILKYTIDFLKVCSLRSKRVLSYVYKRVLS